MSRKYIIVIIVPLIMLLFFSLFLIFQGPSLSVYEEIVPITYVKTMSLTSLTTIRYQTQIQRSQILFSGNNLLIPMWGYRYSGPYKIEVGRMLKISWEADTIVNVYVLNDVDWNTRLLGAPTRWRASEVGQKGTLQYRVSHYEPLYVQVLCPTWCNAKLYRWEEKIEWIENIETMVLRTYVIPREEIEVINSVKKIEVPDYSNQQYGILLAITSSVMLIIVVTAFIIRSSGKEDIYKERDALKYQNLIQELENLRKRQERLKTIYEEGNIKPEIYAKLNDELVARISEVKESLSYERSMYEKELNDVKEEIRKLKDKVEELKVRKDIGIIDEKTFNKNIEQIKISLKKLLEKKNYLESILNFLMYEDEESRS